MARVFSRALGRGYPGEFDGIQQRGLARHWWERANEVPPFTERFRRPDFGHLQLEVTFDDPKTFTKPFTLRTEETYSADTELLEDVCENERDSRHLVGGFKVAAETLAQYAGTYELPGREALVTISGDQLIIKDSAHPRDQLFVARSETQFLSNVSEAFIEFVKDATGTVTQFIRMDGAGRRRPCERAVRLKDNLGMLDAMRCQMGSPDAFPFMSARRTRSFENAHLSGLWLPRTAVTHASRKLTKPLSH